MPNLVLGTYFESNMCLARLSFEHKWLYLCCLLAAAYKGDNERLIITENESLVFQVEDLADMARLSVEETRDGIEKIMSLRLMEQGDDGVYFIRDFGRTVKFTYRPPANEWIDLRTQVFARDDYTCSYCGERGGKLECDHIMPVSKGGTHDLDNLTTACFKCNRSKYNKLPDEWHKSNGTTPLV